MANHQVWSHSLRLTWKLLPVGLCKCVTKSFIPGPFSMELPWGFAWARANTCFWHLWELGNVGVPSVSLTQASKGSSRLSPRHSIDR